MKSFVKNNGLSLAMLVLFVASLFGQILTGYNDHNNDLQQDNQAQLSMGQYLVSGACVEAVFENWESEFLQMGVYVVLTVFLFQRGSSESKDADAQDPVDEDPRAHRNDPKAPWPVRYGGLLLAVYNNSLSLALFALFAMSFLLHAFGGAREYSREQLLHGQAAISMWQYMATSRFWFESFQNWQSEFLSILAIVVLSIFLRQHGSPESKPVHAPHAETGH